MALPDVVHTGIIQHECEVAAQPGQRAQRRLGHVVLVGVGQEGVVEAQQPRRVVLSVRRLSLAAYKRCASISSRHVWSPLQVLPAELRLHEADGIL